MSVEQSVEWELIRKTEVLGENLPLRHFVHHKSHMNWPELKSGPRGGKSATNPLSYGTAAAVNVTTNSVRFYYNP
jgi:hypothetical protein